MHQIATTNPALHGLDAPQAWDTARAFEQLRRSGLAETKRTAERRINSLGIWPDALDSSQLKDALNRPLRMKVLEFALAQARRKREKVFSPSCTRYPADARVCMPTMRAVLASGCPWQMPALGR